MLHTDVSPAVHTLVGLTRAGGNLGSVPSVSVRLLLTNDDGVRSPGLHALVERAAASGHEVVVAAPLEDYSGWGAALGPVHRTGTIAYEICPFDDIAPCPAYGVDGPPALAVMGACLGAFGPPPDAVLSGVNPGANTGQAVIHSGTVGAVLTALHFGIPGVAVSLAVDDRCRRYWDVAASAAVAAVRWLAACDPAIALNVNVPNGPAHALRGVCAAGLSTAGMVQAVATDTGTGRIAVELPPHRPPEPGSDWAVLQEGFVSVTPLQPLQPSPGVDVLRAATAIERAMRAAPALV